MVSSRVFMFMHIYLFRQKENLECGGTDEDEARNHARNLVAKNRRNNTENSVVRCVEGRRRSRRSSEVGQP